MKKFNKNIAKEFKTSFGRFIAIMAIIALGVGFLIGIMQATPDMKKSMHNYYESTNAYDVDVKGTFGLTDGDIESLQNSEVVEQAVPIISTDAVVTVNDQETVGRIIGMSFEDEISLTKLEIVEGRLPQKSTEEGVVEVVVARSNKNFHRVELNDVITLPETIGVSDAQYGDVYSVKQFKVVGIVSSPDYYYIDGRETSSIGTGAVGCVLYCNADEVYDLQKSGSIFSYLALSSIDIRYTDCYIKLKGADEYEKFSDEYKNFVLDQTDNISALGEATSQKINDVLSSLGTLLGQTFAEAEWYILDRASTNVSYVSFDLNVEKVEEIAGIFPIFFIVVAALVALTSMTRMVEEDRMQIGTFKALGYGNARIMSKYLIYCCLASIIGCVVGILLGFSLLPSIIWQAYGTMYQLPSLSLAFSPLFALAVFGIALAGTILVTWVSSRASLREKPSKLMQPKAPKPGKRVLLERVGFFWNHLKFKWKATIRNIFRYKKNMLLTIISVMGCTALILTGFGLNDSVQSVTEIQYGKVILYDSIVEYSGDLQELTQDSALRGFIGDEAGAGEKYLSLYGENGQLILGADESDHSVENVDLYLVENAEEFNAFVSLHERKSSAIIDITSAGNDAVVISENIAVVYDLHVGDTVEYRAADGTTISLTVYGICENYTGGYIYMSRAAYLASTGKSDSDMSHNTLFVKSGVSRDEVDQVTKSIFDDNSGGVNVSSIEFIYSSMETFEGLESTMGLVIAVLVISAGALAAIVLYNLTNINIDERRREIATLRVLGYRKYEVAGYIYRESAILTFFGTLLGLLLGFFLHMYIVGRVNSVSMMFGRVISGWSYLWAFLLTIAFAVVVYAFMLIKLNRINMAESLKSNE